MDSLFKTLYTASMSMEAFLLISAVLPVYFADLLSSFLTLWYVVFRIGSHCLRDKHNRFIINDPKSKLGVFYRQKEHRIVSSQLCRNRRKWKQLDPLWCWPLPNTRWTPFTHRERNCCRWGNLLVRSDPVCSICQRLTKSITSLYRFKRLSNPV